MRSGRIKVVVAVGLFLIAGVVFAWNMSGGSGGAGVDEALVEKAAERSRAAMEQGPPPAAEPMPAGSFAAPMTKRGGG